MAYSYDYFVAAIECPVCRTTSAADDSIGMQTYIRDRPNAEFLRVGSPLYIDAQAIERNACDGYLKIRTPESGEPIRLLHPWNCAVCGAYHWAQIEVRDGLIASIASVPLDREALERSHLISNEADFMAASLMNMPASEIVGKDTVRILRERL